MNTRSLPETSLWSNRKCLFICCVVAIANLQYGFDNAAVGAFQAMPGFLRVFGYEDPESTTGWGIDVCVFCLASHFSLGCFVSCLQTSYIELCPTAHHVFVDAGIVSFFAHCGPVCGVLGTERRIVGCLWVEYRGMCDSDYNDE